MTSDWSDETLSALVDGELAPTEAEPIYLRMQSDANLTARVCALRELKARLRQAYEGNALPAVATADPLRTHPWLGRSLAASVLLLAGLAGGWWLGRGAAPSGFDGQLAALQPLQVTAERRVDRILLHLDSNEPGQLRRTLDQAEAFLELARNEHVALQVEIVVNSDGLDLVRADRTPFAARILRLSRDHRNLRFVACNNTIQRVRRAGETVALVPEVIVTGSAIGTIVERLQEGWSYVRM